MICQDIKIDWLGVIGKAPLKPRSRGKHHVPHKGELKVMFASQPLRLHEMIGNNMNVVITVQCPTSKPVVRRSSPCGQQKYTA